MNEGMEKIDLKLFTVSELREWLIHNQSVRGLSEALISKQRAYAIVMNPNAKEDMPVISALFVNDEVAAYTACFPDVMERPKGMQIQWCTTLYVSPKFEGRGYAYVVLQQMIEVYGDAFLDLYAAEASQANINYTGLKIDYIEQYIFSRKLIAVPRWVPKKLRGTYVRCANRMLKDKVMSELKKHSYTIAYLPQMDDATYAFIKEHSHEDMFLRAQDTFTWMLQHGFRQEGPLVNRVESTKEFPGCNSVYRLYGVQVLKEGKIVGFYLLRNSTDDLAVKYLYYAKEHADDVFASIAEHMLVLDNKLFVTHDQSLAEYIANMSEVYKQESTEKISFSHPASFSYDSAKRIQGGDGDMFV